MRHSRSVPVISDEYTSSEIGKHTLRAMRGNAAQGFWNGSKTPFGYQTEEAERRGAKIKKRLVIDKTEAAAVRRIYDHLLGRDGAALGVKAIVNRLNETGERFRGKPFHISNVHRILISETYTGTHYFNCTEAKTGRQKPHEEWIATRVPAIVSREAFDLAQSSLAARNPKRTPPRMVSSPTLLTGTAICGTCGSGMTIRTGKGGRYRYYACVGCAQKGKTRCPGRSISMPWLDEAVLSHLGERLFTEAHLTEILRAHMDRSDASEATRRERHAQAKRALTEAGGRLSRLLQLVEEAPWRLTIRR